MKPQPIKTAPKSNFTRILVWVNGWNRKDEWWPAHYKSNGDYGPGWYSGAGDGTGGDDGYPEDEVEWWMPMPPAPEEQGL